MHKLEFSRQAQSCSKQRFDCGGEKQRPWLPALVRNVSPQLLPRLLWWAALICPLTSLLLLLLLLLPGFGVPNRRRRIFILASMHGDARDVLLGQVRVLDCTMAAQCWDPTPAMLAVWGRFGCFCSMGINTT
jgi:hypothetical protein